MIAPLLPRHRPSRPALSALLARGALVGAALALWPAGSLAATASSCVHPPVAVPEAPGGPVVLVAAALAALVAIAAVRRHRGAPAALIATLTVVVMSGALLSLVAASADTCHPGGVLGTTAVANGISGPTPYTGADIPWVNAAILVVGGAVVTTLAVPWRRPRLGPGR